MDEVKRLPNGRYAPGHGCSHHGNAGRKRREDEDVIKASLDAALPSADVVQRLASAVERGQPWAVQLWLAYRWGRPVERVDADVAIAASEVAGLLEEVREALPDAEAEQE